MTKEVNLKAKRRFSAVFTKKNESTSRYSQKEKKRTINAVKNCISVV
jgi:hypothetical protein